MPYRRFAILLIVVAALTILAYRSCNRPWIYFHDAETLRRQKEYAAAASIYQRLWNSGFTKRPVFERLTESLYATTNFTGVIQVCRSALAVSAPATPSGTPVRAAEDAIPDWQARWELARALSYTRQFDESIREYQTLLRERPQLATARTELAETLYGAGQPDAALRELLLVPEAALPEKSRLLLADLYAANQDYDTAEIIFRRHLAAHPADTGTRVKLADVLSWNDQYDEALGEYETLLKQKPDDIQIRRKYANVLMWAGRNQEAAAEFKKTLK